MSRQSRRSSRFDDDAVEFERNIQNLEAEQESELVIETPLVIIREAPLMDVLSAASPSQSSTTTASSLSAALMTVPLLEYGVDADELKEIEASLALQCQKESSDCLIVTKPTLQVLQAPFSPSRSVSSSVLHSPNPLNGSPVSSSEFLANKRKQMDESRSKINAQLKEIETGCSPKRKCLAFEDVKRLKSEHEVQIKRANKTKLRLEVADSVLDEVKAIWKRRGLLMQQLQQLL